MAKIMKSMSFFWVWALTCFVLWSVKIFGVYDLPWWLVALPLMLPCAIIMIFMIYCRKK
jgi:hypothetical protein